jgi:hypothetical protein
MAVRRLGLVLALALVFALNGTAARAEEHDKDVAAGFVISPQSVLVGGYLSGAKAIGRASPGRERPWTVPLELSSHSGRHDGANRTQALLLTGARYTRGFGQGKGSEGDKHMAAVFLHVLLGGVWTRDGLESFRLDGAVGGGVGLEYLFSKWGGLRLQGDVIGSDKSFARLSVGVVYRFEHD